MVKVIRNPFRLNAELNYTAIKDIRNLFGLEKETKAIKDYKAMKIAYGKSKQF